MEMDHMSFHTNVHNTILFESWHTMTWEELLGSCIGIAIIAALYEGFKVAREHVHACLAPHQPTPANDDAQENKCECNVTDGSSTNTGGGGSTVIAIPDDSSGRQTKPRPAILSTNHVIQTCMHFVQLWIGYCLMLIFMTYNVYLCLAITVGAAVGYFCFAWMRPHHGASSSSASSSTYSGMYSGDCCQ